MRHALALAALLGAAPAIAQKPAASTPPSGAAQVRAPRRIEIRVTDLGFEPRELRVKKGEPVTLVFTRVTERTCITAVDIPDEKVANLKLPLNAPAEVTITPRKAGIEAFHCSAMAMGNGRILVDD